jgi:hypothetical protein
MIALPYTKRPGIAIPLAIVAIMILLALSVSLLSLGASARLYSIRNSEDIIARSAADAGITKALYDMNAKLQVTPWNDSFLPGGTDISLIGCNATYSYVVTKYGGSYIVEATGKCGGTQRKIRCTFVIDSPFDSAVFCESYIWLHNSCVVDQYNADASVPPLKVGTNSTDRWQLCLYSDAQIVGDAVVGAGGDPTVTIDNKGIITGKQYAMSTPEKLVSVEVPYAVEALPSQGTLEDGEVTVSGKYDSIDLGSNKTITVKGPVTLYVTGDVKLGNSAQIIVDNATPESSLTLYIGGNFSGDNSSNINNLTKIPRNVQIFALDSCTKINMKNDVSFYGTIYAPQTDVVYNNSASLYGSVIAGSFETKNSSPIHYDASLREASANDPLVKFRVANWIEVK